MSPSRRRKDPRATKGTSYKKGADFEHYVRRKLHAAGWTVLRSSGSHDAVDLIAWRQPPPSSPSDRLPFNRIVAIQCKRDGEIAPKERLKALAFCVGLTQEVYVVRSSAGVADGRWQVQARPVAFYTEHVWEPFDNVF